jgi:hypothetical protein
MYFPLQYTLRNLNHNTLIAIPTIECAIQ